MPVFGFAVCGVLLLIALLRPHRDPLLQFSIRIVDSTVALNRPGPIQLTADITNDSAVAVTVTKLFAEMSCRAEIEVAEQGIVIPPSGSRRVAMKLAMDEAYLCPFDQESKSFDFRLTSAVKAIDTPSSIANGQTSTLTFRRPIRLDRPYVRFDGADPTAKQSGRSTRRMTIQHDPNLHSPSVNTPPDGFSIEAVDQVSKTQTVVEISANHDIAASDDVRLSLQFEMRNQDDEPVLATIPIIVAKLSTQETSS